MGQDVKINQIASIYGVKLVFCIYAIVHIEYNLVGSSNRE